MKVFTTLVYLLSLQFILYSQQIKISRNDPGIDEYFGHCVAIHGDYAIIGAYFDDQKGWGSGSAYIFKFENNTWIQKQKLTPSDIDAYDFFGSSVDIDNNLAVVGANSDNGTGTAYIYRNNNGNWIQEGKLIPSNGINEDFFGSAVGIDDDIIAVGASGDDFHTGSVYIFKNENGQWKEKQNIYLNDGKSYDLFGNVIAFDNSTLVIGANNYGGVGAAFVYLQDGETFEKVAKLQSENNDLNDKFGTSISVSQNYIAVGANYNDEGGLDCGAAYIFQREGNSWNQVKKIIPDDGITNEQFGHVAISNELIAVGADKDDDMGIESGSVYLYSLDGNEFNFIKKITADDGFAGDGFGQALDIDNFRLIVGSPYDNDGSSNSGSSYIIDLENILDLESASHLDYSYQLLQNFPNPFNPSTKIIYTLAQKSFVSLKVFDILGAEVVMLLNEQKEQGMHEVYFDGSKLPSGIYFYSLHARNPETSLSTEKGSWGEGFTETKKMILIR